MHDPSNGLLGRLLALAPPGCDRISALVRQTCAKTLSLRALPAEVAVDGPADGAESVLVDFAEQFSVDVSSIGDELRGRFTSTLGESTLPAVVLIYIADFLPRLRAGFEALDLPVPWPETVEWDHDSDFGDLLFNQFLPGIARLSELDSVTTEVVRLRGATQHNCRLCKSLREGNALDAGGSETMYEQIEWYETSTALAERHKSALRYVDALVWTPSSIEQSVAAGIRAHFTESQAFELSVDVMRNASNKIAVSLAADAPRVSSGTERYLMDDTGQMVYS